MEFNISVVIATYNGEKYILRQLESIFKQTLSVNEVVICDDNSSDSTVKIIEAFIKKNKLINWRLYINGENLGYKNNFKKCIRLVKGDVIFLCDQDDIWKPDKVEKLIGIFYRYPSCLSVVTNFKLIDSSDQYVINDKNSDNPWFNDRSCLIDDDLYMTTLSEGLLHCVSPGCTQAFRSELKEEILSFTVDYPHDYIVSILAVIKGGLYYYDKALTLYRKHDNNTSGIPNFVVLRRKGKKIKLLAYYIFYIIRFCKCCFHKELIDNYNKVSLVEELDKYTISCNQMDEYNKWKDYVINRTCLYDRNKGNKKKYYLKQKRHFGHQFSLEVSTGDSIERFALKSMDLIARLKL